jgi:hypothetical protein
VAPGRELRGERVGAAGWLAAFAAGPGVRPAPAVAVERPREVQAGGGADRFATSGRGEQGVGTQAQFLSKMADQFQQASQTGQLPQPSQGAHGHHHHHHAGGSGAQAYASQQQQSQPVDLAQIIGPGAPVAGRERDELELRRHGPMAAESATGVKRTVSRW